MLKKLADTILLRDRGTGISKETAARDKRDHDAKLKQIKDRTKAMNSK